LSWTLVAVNVAGHAKRTTTNAVWFVSYAAGNIIGPFLFLPDEAPRYLTPIKALAGMFGSCIFFTVCLGVTMFAENRRSKEFVVLEDIADEDGFTDRTDGENMAFRYKLQRDVQAFTPELKMGLAGNYSTYTFEDKVVAI
jgi:hypothetical protein